MKARFQKHINKHQFYGAILAMMFLLTISSFGFNQVAELLDRQELRDLQTANISDFYSLDYIKTTDACVGDEFHFWTSKRTVSGTESGWQAEITRELFRLTGENAGKVYDEFAIVNIEPRDEEGNRRQHLPYLRAGQYEWHIGLVLYLNQGVERHDVPIGISEPFWVRECD